VALLKADWQKLRSDRQSARAVIQADRAQLISDVKAAHEAKQGGGIKALRQAMHTANQALRADVKQAVQDARAATKSLRESLKAQGKSTTANG